MDANKMHVMADIKTQYKSKGLDTGDISELVHKDKSTVDKQFAEKNGTQTLLTAYGYAAAAGGRVIFVLDEEWENLKAIEKEIPELREQLRDKEKQLANATEAARAAAQQIEAQTKIIQRLEKQLDDKDESIRRKEAVISRKDGVIGDLLRKAGAI